jgi:hypothetical protein
MYVAMLSGTSLPFRRNKLLPSSGRLNEVSRKQAAKRASYLLLGGLLQGLPSDAEGEDDTFLRNFSELLQDHMTS